MLLKDIWKDVKAVQERDPAARSALEVLILYQGVHALIWHRIAHWFWLHHMRFAGRLISQLARFFTQIEIHPGATLGHGILIDHGCGVVIGETAVVGDNCTIYQGVTLGGVGTQKGKRHPTIGNDVMIGAGAKILGAFQVGDHCAIAANAVLLKPLEENSTAAGVPARAVKIDGVPVPDMKTAVTMEHYCQMEDAVEKLKNQVEELQNMAGQGPERLQKPEQRAIKKRRTNSRKQDKKWKQKSGVQAKAGTQKSARLQAKPARGKLRKVLSSASERKSGGRL